MMKQLTISVVERVQRCLIKKAYSTEFYKDVSNDTISLSQERDFAQLIKIIDEDNDKFKIVNESCKSKSTSLEMDKDDGSYDTYYEMEKADSISREIRKNDGKALFCKFAPCTFANLKLLLTILQIYFCPVQLIQKLGQISLGTKFVMIILELLKYEDLKKQMKEENVDWKKLMNEVNVGWKKLMKEVNVDWEKPMKKVLAKLKKTTMMPCTNILIALQKKGFLTSIFKKEVGVGRKQYFLNTAINEFKMSQHKAGLMIYITA
ncbi:uncharacterized protein LOC124448357 isoform X2 [Xenia sp. Carnegie-2017]|uniref:uncharacterized protein LOC124448357 isoform X2 n=1 Tax=Xenia sp. Carnegie-2017 TaxID=2897299 RepID=UPI001F03451B|nr:uncharacterized protein LOC124448357 isoform X2 [Xenia sp. Carnegie-2017]